MKPVGFVSSFSASSKQYPQSRSVLSQYHLGRSQPETSSLSGRQLDRNIYKTPDQKNAPGISAGAAGVIGYSTPSLECSHRKDQENENDANDREFAIRKKNYLHYTADHVRLQRNSSNYVDISQALSISARPADISSREVNRSKENQHRGAHISPSRLSSNSYSGFISRSMNSSFLQRQAHSSINNSYYQPTNNHSNLLSDSMISDCSPPKSRLNQSSVIQTTEWQIPPSYGVAEAQRKTENNERNSWNTCDYSLSANKATECTDFSRLLISANPDKRMCFSESKDNSSYSMSQSENTEHTKEVRTLSQADRNSKESIQINQTAQEQPLLNKTDDVFKSIHIDAKAALALLESLDTTAITSKKLSCLSYNDSSSWRKSQNAIVRQEDTIIKSSDTKSILRNQRDSLRTAAPEGIISAITEQLKANCIGLESSQMSSQAAPHASILHASFIEDKSNNSQPSASEQQQPQFQEAQSASLPSFEKHVSPAVQDKQADTKKDLSALQILQLQQQTQEKYSNDRQRAIQERIRRVEEITKKYSHLYQKDKDKKKDTTEFMESAINSNKDKQEIAIIQQQQQQQQQQQEKYQEQVCQQTLEVVAENNCTPRFPTTPGITYFTSAEEIRVFSASKNNASNTNDKSKETLQTKEDEQQQQQ